MAAETARRVRLGTVRARTTIAAVVVMGAALIVGGVALVTVLRRSLISDIDQVAELHAADLAEQARRGHLDRTLGADEDEVVQILDGERRVVAATVNGADLPPIAALEPAGESPATRTIGTIRGVPGEFRLLAASATAPTGPITIYVATNLKPADATLLFLRTSFLIGAPLLLVLVGVTTWAATGRALAPVEAIRAEVADISRRDLGRRVTPPGTHDEVSELAATMNEMLDRLQGAVEQQRRFVADASHELQSPLAANRADLEVALTHPRATDWTTTARDLLDENTRMERLVADLLFIARSDAGASRRVRAPVDLRDVILEEASRITCTGRLHVDTTSLDAAVVAGVRDDLARAVRNLLDNARRHARSRVAVELHTADTNVILAIVDDGPGIPPEHRERIFDRFARVDDARSRHAGGTGLGLAIVKDIVERHDGTITVQSVAPTGARFVVVLPTD